MSFFPLLFPFIIIKKKKWRIALQVYLNNNIKILKLLLLMTGAMKHVQEILTACPSGFHTLQSNTYCKQWCFKSKKFGDKICHREVYYICRW